MDVIPKYKFRKIIAHYKGARYVKSFSCWQQLLCLCFGQFTFRSSLRNLVITLEALGSRRYHMGIIRPVARSTFSDANTQRPWQIYRELAMLLASRALASNDKDAPSSEVAESVYALDSSTIDLCLSLFPWAKFRSYKSAIKMHTLMDIEASVPLLSIGLTQMNEYSWDQVELQVSKLLIKFIK